MGWKVKQVTPAMEVLGPLLGNAKETRRNPTSTESLPGQALCVLLVSSSVTLSHVGNVRLWEVLGLAQLRGLGGSLITQACLAFEPIVHTLDTPVVFEHF